MLHGPGALAADPAGNLYVADANNLRVRVIRPDGTAGTLIGNGRPRQVSPWDGDFLEAPQAMAIDPAGNLYVSDRDQDVIRKVAPDGQVTWLGLSPDGLVVDSGLTIAGLGGISAMVAGPDGALYVAVRSRHRVYRLDRDGRWTTLAGNGRRGATGDGGPAAAATLSGPSTLALDPAGNLYVGEWEGYRVRRVAPDGTIATVAGTGTNRRSGDGGPATAAGLSAIYALAADGAGNLYIGEQSRVRRVGPDGTIATVAGDVRSAGYLGDGGPAVGARLSMVAGLAADRTGNLYIADSGNDRIRRVGGDGTIVTVAGTGTCGYGPDGRRLRPCGWPSPAPWPSTHPAACTWPTGSTAGCCGWSPAARWSRWPARTGESSPPNAQGAPPQAGRLAHRYRRRSCTSVRASSSRPQGTGTRTRGRPRRSVNSRLPSSSRTVWNLTSLSPTRTWPRLITTSGGWAAAARSPWWRVKYCQPIRARKAATTPRVYGLARPVAASRAASPRPTRPTTP